MHVCIVERTTKRVRCDVTVTSDIPPTPHPHPPLSLSLSHSLLLLLLLLLVVVVVAFPSLSQPDKVDLTPDEARRFANIVKGDN